MALPLGGAGTRGATASCIQYLPKASLGPLAEFTMKVKGKVALITGGASGFGRMFAIELLKKGARGVSLVDNNVFEGEQTARELSGEYGAYHVLFCKADVTADSEMDAAFRKTLDYFRRLDIVCNNAGIPEIPDWQKIVDIDLSGVIRGTLLAKKYMDKNAGGNGGVVINVSSMAGILFSPDMPVYCGAKRGVIGFTNSICLPGGDPVFQPDNIRINTICPTFSPTGIFMKQNEGFSKEEAEQIANLLPTVPVAKVVEGYMRLVEEDEHHGEVMRVTLQKGIDFHKFHHRKTKPLPKL